MPEQQKVDETMESTSILKKKNTSKVEQSSTALENDLKNASGTEVIDQDIAPETEVDDLEEQ